MLKTSLIVSTITLLSVFSMAQEKQTPLLNSNRIGLTESSRTVVKGGFLLEGGFSTSQATYGDPYNKRKFSYINTPQLKIGYGINHFLEGFVQQNSYRIDYGNTNGMSSDAIGFGLKMNLSKQKGMMPQSAISLSENFRRLDGGRQFFETRVNFSWSYDLGSRFNLAGNILYNYSEHIKHGVGLGLKLSYNVNSKLGLFTEWYLADYMRDFTVFNLGAYYRITPKIMLSANIGTNDFLIDYSYAGGSGYSYSAKVGVSFLLYNQKKSFHRKMKKIR